VDEPKVNINWEEMTPKHNIHIPEHKHKTEGLRENMATWYSQHAAKKTMLNKFLRRLWL
jgi:hypothetical protein